MAVVRCGPGSRAGAPGRRDVGRLDGRQPNNAASRLGEDDTILYFGDFDPSGEDMVRSLRARLASLGSHPEVVKCALTFDDVRRYDLPADFTKTTDTRRAAFIARFGDLAVELDALPLEVLRHRIIAEVESRLDLTALQSVREEECFDRDQLIRALMAVVSKGDR